MSFWDQLSRPLLTLAPMADVTDAAFRHIIAKYSKPADFVMWTEFVSADGLARAPEEGRKKLLADLMFSDAERPIVAQFFGARPENIEKAARLAVRLGFDGVDINMGCPDKSIEKQGAGAAHIKNPELAQEIVAAAKRGAGALPVSVKTRLGYNKDELEEWLPVLLKTGLAAVTLHLRTRKEMSLVPARWERIVRAVEIRNAMKVDTLILGNGDLTNVPDALARVKETGADGAMLGKAVFGNPWLFSDHTPSIEERLSVMVEHTKLFEQLLPHKSFAIMKKHYKTYAHGFPGAAELRTALMNAQNGIEVESIVDKWLVPVARC